MKIGDRFTVYLDSHAVAEAVVEDIEDDKATLIIPATRLVMGIASSLTDLPEEIPEVEHQFAGLQDLEPGTSKAQEEVNAADDIGSGIRNANLDSSILD
jgi:hypothetical protein